MASKAARKLYAVDEKSGELRPAEEACPGCFERDVQLAGAEKEIRSWRARYASLKATITEDEGHELFPAAKRLFDFWKERCNHPRSDFTAERFAAVLPHLRDLGEELCHRAIEGAAYDPFTTKRKNGTIVRHDSWGLIFRSRDKTEEFANRAPYHLPDPKAVHTLTEALLFLWPLEIEEAVDSAQRMLRR